MFTGAVTVDVVMSVFDATELSVVAVTVEPPAIFGIAIESVPPGSSNFDARSAVTRPARASATYEASIQSGGVNSPP